MQVGLGSGYIVLDGGPSSPSDNFLPIAIVAKRLGHFECIKMPLDMEATLC